MLGFSTTLKMVKGLRRALILAINSKFVLFVDFSVKVGKDKCKLVCKSNGLAVDGAVKVLVSYSLSNSVNNLVFRLFDKRVEICKISRGVEVNKAT